MTSTPEQLRWTPETDPSMERIRSLILAVGEAAGNRHGWKQEFAARADVRPEHLARVISRARRVSMETARRIERAAGSATAPPTDDAEFSVMRALIALDDQTRARVLAWAESRWPR